MSAITVALADGHPDGRTTVITTNDQFTVSVQDGLLLVDDGDRLAITYAPGVWLSVTVLT